jgi:Spy/CpxP family protein refolding chaperone
MWRTITLILAVCCLVPVTLVADDDVGPPYGMMRGGMGGMMGMGGGMMGMGAYHMLDLTDDQRSKINKLQDEERRKHWETMGKIMDQRARLRDLNAAEKRDIPAILKAQEESDRLQRQMLELHLNTQNQIDALLTKEQREQVRSYRRRGMGPGMMWQDGMGPGGRGMMR